MAEQMVLDTEYGTVWVDAANKIVHHQFKQWIKGEAFRELLDTGYQQLVANGCTKWLSDDRANSVLPQEDEEWAKHDWFPRVIKAGWKHWAIVLPEKAVGQMNMERFRREYKELGINTNAFKDPEEARKWLLEQD